MLDQADKEAEKSSSSSSSTSCVNEGQLIKKICSDCGTSKTPLWRGGPAGPKSLCNACGIRSRKRRRALLGLNKPEENRCKKIIINNTTTSCAGVASDSSGVGDGEMRVMSDMKLRGLMWQRSTAGNLRRKLGEEEQAAVLLMAMAYSTVFA